jgi:hypothetical protein
MALLTTLNILAIPNTQTRESGRAGWQHCRAAPGRRLITTLHEQYRLGAFQSERQRPAMHMHAIDTDDAQRRLTASVAGSA